MAKVNVFAACRMRTFARLISHELGVQVVLKGREVCVEYGPPPTIYLPNMEYATDDDVRPICGLCLHEAGHLVYTNFKVLEEIPNYLVKFLHNAIEDEYMERMLEKDFPGARDMLVTSITEAVERMYEKRDKNGKVIEKGQLPGRKTTYLNDDGRKEVVKMLKGYAKSFCDAHGIAASDENIAKAAKELGHDFNDEAKVEDVAKRMELDRVARLWFVEQRRYPHDLLDWPSHPWHSVFAEETFPRAKNSTQTLEQAVKIIARLGIKPCMPGDVRPVQEARALTATAEKAREAAREARKAVSEKEAERDEKIEERQNASAEHQKVLDCRDDAEEAHEEKAKANKANAKARKQLNAAKAASRVTRKRLAEERKKARELRREIRNAEDEEAKALLEEQEKNLEARIEQDAELLERRMQDAEELQQNADATLEELQAARQKASDADVELKRAEKADEEEAARIASEVKEEYKPEIKPLAEAAEKADDEAEAAVDAANKVLEAIQKRDGEIEEQFEPGALAKIIKEVFEQFRAQKMEDEMNEALGKTSYTSDDEGHGGKEVEGLEAVVESRKYCPFSREYDSVDKVSETPNAKQKYEAAKKEYAAVIDETTQRLRRLYSPQKTRVKVNAEEGRLDPRKAYKIGLAQRGVAVNLERMWKTIQVRKDPKVAITMLLDCSGSMLGCGTGGKTSLAVGQETAACLSEVMTNLGIPHEIIGHTTKDRAAQMMRNGELALRDLTHYSRVEPFQGYLFKGFEEKTPPVTVFSEFELSGNVDGEAVHWAVDRLANRPERTKICISISDGMPCCEFSNTPELERHLYLACKQIEQRERDGLFLFGVGIGCDRVAKFYKNNHVIKAVADLPKTVLGVVEHVLTNLVGSMA